MSSISNRFRQLRKALKLTQTELGNEIGKKLRTIQDYEYDKATITDGVLLNLQEKFNVNIEWMRTGKGEMFLSESSSSSSSPAFTEIPYYYSIKASAGYGAFNYNEDYEPFLINSRLVKNKELECIIGVLGNSMEPELYNNDKVLVTRDKGQTLEPRKNKIYVIRQDDSLYIKRFAGINKGRFVFKSDNKDYDNDIILENTSDIIAVVKCLIMRDYNIE